MLLMAFMKWWYGAGWAGTFTKSEYYAKNLAGSFSAGTLARTLFAPWKQMDAFAGVNQDLAGKLRHALDKFVSRFIGFFVRFFTLLTALVSVALLIILRAVWMAVWPLLPLAVPLLILYGFGVAG